MDYECDYIYDSNEGNPHENLELRDITVNPKPPPAISFVFITGIVRPGTRKAYQRFAKDFNI